MDKNDKAIAIIADNKIQNCFEYYSNSNYDSLWDIIEPVEQYYNPHLPILKNKFRDTISMIHEELGSIKKIVKKKIKKKESLWNSKNGYFIMKYNVLFENKQTYAKFIYKATDDTLSNLESFEINKHYYDFILIKNPKWFKLPRSNKALDGKLMRFCRVSTEEFYGKSTLVLID
jgi:hypothetical protein